MQALPIMTPSMVNAALSLSARSASMATFTVSPHAFTFFATRCKQLLKSLRDLSITHQIITAALFYDVKRGVADVFFQPLQLFAIREQIVPVPAVPEPLKFGVVDKDLRRVWRV